MQGRQSPISKLEVHADLKKGTHVPDPLMQFLEMLNLGQELSKGHGVASERNNSSVYVQVM